MDNDSFEMPDLDGLMKEMADAMEEAQGAMENLPEMGEIQNIMGSLSSLIEGLPGDMKDLTGAIADFDEQHTENMQSAAGEPDWEMHAKIYVGKKLQIAVQAALDVENTIMAYQSTQGDGFEDLVGSVVAGTGEEFDSDTMGQIMGQLKKGRSIAQIIKVDVLACHIQGAPSGAAQKLQLSPEANIPLTMDEHGLGLEFAPMLTIRNKWEHANLPTFTPMAEEIKIPVEAFSKQEPFSKNFDLVSQKDPIQVELAFTPTN